MSNTRSYLNRNSKTAFTALLACAAGIACLAGPAPASAAADGVAVPKFTDITSNQAKIDAARGDLNTKIDAEKAKLDQLDALISELIILHSEITVMGGDLQVLESSSMESSSEMIERIDSGREFFNAQLAELLSPELAAQVSQELDAARQTFTATATFSDGTNEDITTRLGALDIRFGSLRDELAAAKEESASLDTAIKASWNLKENVK
jgi:hypothetical protein